MPQPKKAAVKSAKQVNGAPKGTFMAFSNGRLARTTPIYKDIVSMESVDTTGYSKGKKDFTLTKTSNGNKNVINKNVKRKDIPSVISGLKKDATLSLDFRTPSQKKKK